MRHSQPTLPVELTEREVRQLLKVLPPPSFALVYPRGVKSLVVKLEKAIRAFRAPG